MISIDKLAYVSGLREVNPMEKFLFSIITMIVCIALNSIVTSLIILLLMGSITIIKGKVSIKSYGELILIPLAFLVIGLLTVAISVVGPDSNALFSFVIFNLKLGCTRESLIIAAKVFFKALGSVSCLYFLALTTPMFEVLMVLGKFKVPKLFIELMGLIYRFIFVLLDTANSIFISQNSRLGYATIRLGYHSLGKLIASLFITSYKKSQQIYIAMESRCYDGDIRLMEEEYRVSSLNIFLIVGLQVVLIAISLLIKNMGGII